MCKLYASTVGRIVIDVVDNFPKVFLAPLPYSDFKHRDEAAGHTHAFGPMRAVK